MMPVLRLYFEDMSAVDSTSTVISKLNDNGLRLNDLCHDAECTICFEDVGTTTGGSLVCGHSFHNNCIQKWFLSGQFNCPNCRGHVDVLNMLN
jgi:hypothetical protein